MPKTFLDLTHYDASRADLRRLEKSLKGVAGFHSKVKRVFFFVFKTEMDRIQFYASITHALTMTGYRYIITEETEYNLTNQ